MSQADRDRELEKLKPEPAIMVRAGEPIPAHMVSHVQEPLWKRVMIAGMIILVVFFGAILAKQSFRNGQDLDKALDVMRSQGAASTQARNKLIHDTSELLSRTRRDEHFVILIGKENDRLRRLLHHQNVELIRLGAPAVKVPPRAQRPGSARQGDKSGGGGGGKRTPPPSPSPS